MSCQDQLKYLNDDYEIRLVKSVCRSSCSCEAAKKTTSTWRSLKTGPQDCPLTLCDFQSVGPEDLASCDRIVSDKAGEIYLFKHNKKQRWYWLDGQTPEEPFLILTWSSESANSQARCNCVSEHFFRMVANSLDQQTVLMFLLPTSEQVRIYILDRVARLDQL